MATEEIYQIIPGGGGHFDTLAGFIADATLKAYDWVSNDKIPVAEVYADTTVAGLDTAGWTLDSTHRIVIRPPTTAGVYQGAYYHYGIESAGVIIDTTGATYHYIVRSGDYLTIQGLELTGSGNSGYALIYAETNQSVRLVDNLIHNLYRSIAATSSIDYMKNCFIYNFQRTSGNYYAGYGGKITNCSIYAEDTEGGFSGDIVVRNAECDNVALFHDHTTDTYDSFFTCTGDYNATNQPNAPGANSVKNLAIGDFNWVDYSGASKDLHIASAAGNLINAGAGNATDADVLTYDIDLEAGDRAGATCDIGADEFVSGGGSASASPSESPSPSVSESPSPSVSESVSESPSPSVSESPSPSVSESPSPSVSESPSPSVSVSPSPSVSESPSPSVSESPSPSVSESPSPSVSESPSPSVSESVSESPSPSVSESPSPSVSESPSPSISESPSPSISESVSESPSPSISESPSPSVSESPSPSVSASVSESPSPSVSESPSPSISESVSESPSPSVSESPSPSISESPSPSPSTAPIDWFNASSLVLTEGTINSGTLADTYSDNGTELVLDEVESAMPGFVFDFTFGEDESVPTSYLYVNFKAWYEGNPAHNVKLQQWDYNGSAWDNVTADAQDFPSAGSEQTYQFTLIDDADHISAGQIQLRIVHTSTGAAGHLFHIDHMYLELKASPSESPSPSISESPSPSVSESSSESPSPSISESLSESPSPSISESPSPSVSVSPSESPSPSISESPSPSVSESPSPSWSESPSASPSEAPDILKADTDIKYRPPYTVPIYLNSEDMMAGNMHPRWVAYFERTFNRADVYAINSVFEVTYGRFHSDGPVTELVSWFDIRIKLNGMTRYITDGSTTKEWIYYNVGASIFTTSDTKPTISDTLFLVGRNVDGLFQAYWPYRPSDEVVDLINGAISVNTISSKTYLNGFKDEDVVATFYSYDNPISPVLDDRYFKIVIDGTEYFKVEETNTTSYVKLGTKLNINSGTLEMGGTQVLTTQQAAIANLDGAAVLADVIAKVNAILAMLRTHGIIDT